MHKTILVVDDKTANVKRAQEQLGNICNLLFANSYTGAIIQLSTHDDIDAVFTDVMLPAEAEGVSMNHPEIGKEVPYGLIIALIAINKGIEAVSLVTDLGHHSGPIAWALDQLKREDYQKANCFETGKEKDWKEVYDFWFKEEVIEKEPKERRGGLFVVGGKLNEPANKKWAEAIAEEIGMQLMYVNDDLSDEEIAKQFIISNPECAIILGEIAGEAKQSNFDKTGPYTKLQGVAKPWQVIFVAGFMKPSVNEHRHYLRLPFTSKELLARLEEERKLKAAL
ncbi:hypothetical protein JXA12_02250 [Candidatus Woesearchaeota archaeon]|nr:hypothetical protein [Candidatus Woesearchaeota archaeon]